MGTVDPRRSSLKSILKKTSKYDTHDEVRPEPTDTSDPPPAAGHRQRHREDKLPHVSQLASMLLPNYDEEDSEDEVDTEPRTPKVPNKSTPDVSSAVDCFTEPPPTPLDSPLEDHEEELFNYQGQVVTRSAMELLEMEDEIAARGGLYERDGVVMTASALSLLQAQEAMARADTAGQGEWGRESAPRWLHIAPDAPANADARLVLLDVDVQPTNGTVSGTPSSTTVMPLHPS
jgi:hypothetical protein